MNSQRSVGFGWHPFPYPPAAALIAGAYGLATLGAAVQGLIRFGMLDPVPAALARGAELSYGYWVALTLLWLQWRLGAAVLPALLRGHPTPAGAATTILQWGVGAYLSYCLILILALAGAMNGGGVAIFLLLAAAGAAAAWRTTSATQTEAQATAPAVEGSTAEESDAHAPHASAGASSPTTFGAWALLVCCVGAAPYLVQALLPSLDADGFMYHLPLAKRFIERPLWTVDPYFPAFNFPGAISLFYSGFLLVGAETAILPYNLLTAGGLLVGVYAIAHHFGGQAAGVWAVLFALPMNVAWEVALTPRVDAQLAVYFVLAALAFLLWLEDTRRTGYLVVLGMLLGMGLGIKYTALALVALFVAAVLVAALRAVHPVRSVAIFGLAVAISPSWFWYGRNAALLGDPAYPMLFRQRLYAEDDGRMRDFRLLTQEFAARGPKPQEMQTALARTSATFLQNEPQNAETRPRHSLNLAALVLAPHWYEMQPFHTVAPFVLLSLAALFCVRGRWGWWLMALMWGAYLLLGYQHWVVRYVLPPLMLFPVAAAIAMVGFARNEAGRRTDGLRWAIGVLLAFFVLCLMRDWAVALTVHPATQGMMRLLPAMVVFGFAVSGVILSLTRPFRGPTQLASVVTITMSLTLALSLTLNWSCEVVKTLAAEPVAYLTGRETAREYLTRRERTGLPALGDWLTQQIEQGSIHREGEVLLLGDYKGSVLPLAYHPDDNFGAYRWRVEVMKAEGDPEKLRRRLIEQNIHYLAINLGQIEWFHHEEPRLYQRDTVAFALFYVQRLLRGGQAQIAYEAPGMLFVQIKPSA